MHHPNIVQYLGHYEDKQGDWCLIMEWMDSTLLCKLQEGNQMSRDEKDDM